MATSGSTSGKKYFDIKKYDDILTSVRNLMRIFGVRLLSDHSDSLLRRRLWAALFWVNLCNMTLGATLEALKIAETAQNPSFESMVQIFRMAPCMGYVMLSITKIWNIEREQVMYRAMLRDVHAMWPRGALTAHQQRIVESAIMELYIFVTGYKVCNVTTLMIYNAPPVVELVRYCLGDHSITLQLPFYFWLPYDSTELHNFVPTLILQMWQSAVVVLFVTIGDLLYCVLLNQISMQFDLLAIELRQIVPVGQDHQLPPQFPLGALNVDQKDANGQPLQLQDDHETEKKLKKIIRRHIKLIKLSESVEHLMSVSLLINFINSSMILCFCGFCCLLVEKWNDPQYKFFLTMALSQTWLLCWYGQKIMDSSTRLSQAAYECGWYQTSGPIKRSLLILLLRAQKPVCVTTCGFSVIGFSCYTQIVKTAWSYFTLLVNLYF